MSPAHRHELQDLVEALVAATEDHAYWLGPVRETSLELRDRLTEWVIDAPVVEPVTANWQCPEPGCRFSAIHPMSHPCPL